MPEALALVKNKQSKFAKKITKLKKKVTKGDVVVKETAAPVRKVNARITRDRGVVYIGHLPHGFYEPEMKAYFSQFGVVTKVRVNRSASNGKSKGFGFVEFKEPEVAKVAAESMDNYLMFKRRLVTTYIPPEKQHGGIFKGLAWKENKTPAMKALKKVVLKKNKNTDEKGHLRSARNKMSSVKQTIQKLAALGIDHNFQPVDAPNITAATEPLIKDKKPTKSKKTALKVENTGKGPLLRKRNNSIVSNDNPKKVKKSDLVLKKKKKVAKNDSIISNDSPLLKKKKATKNDSIIPKKILKKVKKSDSVPLLEKDTPKVKKSKTLKSTNKQVVIDTLEEVKKPIVKKIKGALKTKAVDPIVTPVKVVAKTKKAKKVETEKKSQTIIEKKSLKTIEKNKTKLLGKKKTVKSMSDKVKLAAKSILDSSLVKQTTGLKKKNKAGKKK